MNTGVALLRQWAQDDGAAGRLSLFLSGGQCRAFLFKAPAGLKGHDERIRAADLMAPSQTGIEGPCTVWLQPASGRTGPQVAVAMDLAWRQRLMEAFEGDRLRLHRIRPWWSEVLDWTLSSSKLGANGLAVQDCDSLTCFLGVQHASPGIATTIAPVFGAERANAALARVRTGSMLLPEAGVTYVALASEPNERGPDFCFGAFTRWPP